MIQTLVFSAAKMVLSQLFLTFTVVCLKEIVYISKHSFSH